MILFSNLKPWRTLLVLRFNCSSDVHQIKVLFAYNKTNSTVHLISLLSIRTQAHLWEGNKWFKKPSYRDMVMITELKTKHIKGTPNTPCCIVNNEWWYKKWCGLRTLWQDDLCFHEGLISPCWGRSVMCVRTWAKAQGEKMDLNSALATKFYSDWHLRTRSQ